jgi:hypothetical protein
MCSVSQFIKLQVILTPKGMRKPKWPFLILGRLLQVLKVVKFLKLLEEVGMDGSFPMRRSM